MIRIRPAAERGHFDHGWLNTFHTFSFGDFYDPEQMGFRTLRVINEDTVAADQGFGTHPHKDMEIITYVLDGELAHKDSMGNGTTILPGDVQRMSAGTGVTHSEFNPSAAQAGHFLQIWIVPEARGLKPSYEQKNFSAADKRGRLRLLVSRDGRDGSVTVHQDADLYATVLAAGESVEWRPMAQRHAWIQVARGEATFTPMGGGAVAPRKLVAGDGVAVSGERRFKLSGASATGEAEVLLFDLS